MWFKESAKHRGETEDRQNCYNVTPKWPTGVFLGLALQCELLPAGGSNVLQGFRPTNSFRETWKDSWDPLRGTESVLPLKRTLEFEKHSE